MYAELAFVNVKFASGEFWVLVVVDFVMLLMRDVRFLFVFCICLLSISGINCSAALIRLPCKQIINRSLKMPLGLPGRLVG